MGDVCERPDKQITKSGVMIASRKDVKYSHRILLGREPSPAEVEAKMIAVEERGLTAHQLGVEAAT